MTETEKFGAFIEAQQALLDLAADGIENEVGIDHGVHIRLAIQLAQQSFNHKLVVAANHTGVDDDQIPQALPGHFYVVKFSYILGNWKALVSTNVVANHYWEITYNANKEEAYVDAYIKEHNDCVPILNYR